MTGTEGDGGEPPFDLALDVALMSDEHGALLPAKRSARRRLTMPI
jgi:hypothetical protein